MEPDHRPNPEPRSNLELVALLGELVTHMEQAQDNIVQIQLGDGLEYSFPLYTAAVEHLRDAFQSLHDADQPSAFFYASAAFASIEGAKKFFEWNSAIDCVHALYNCPLAFLQRDWEAAQDYASEFEEAFAEFKSPDFRYLRKTNE